MTTTPQSFLLVLLATFLPTLLIAQKKEAYQHIQTLKERTLLIRINTFSNKLEQMRIAGLETEAKELQTKLYYKNRAFIKAFQEHFDFCPVYFFLAEDARSIKQGEYEGFLLDANLQPLTNLPTSLKQAPPYVLVMGPMGFKETFSRSKREGLRFLTHDFNPLPKQFPDYTLTKLRRWYNDFSLPKQGDAPKEQEIIQEFNHQLLRFHDKALRKRKGN